MDAELRKSLTAFINEFSHDVPRLEAMRQGIELFGATRLSTFSLLNPNENALSRIIAELLNPRGAHGQGLLFLNSFLQALGIPRVKAREAVHVRLEVYTRERRRIDIVVETRDYVIGIENKPWAAQQIDQLEDYRKELSDDFLGRVPILIFLSDQEPKTAKEATLCVPYYAGAGELSLHGVFEQVSSEIKATPTRAFVEDLLRHIESNFGGNKLEDESDRPYLDAVHAEFDEVSERRKAVAAILLTQKSLHHRILDEIGDYLTSEVVAATDSRWEMMDDRGLGHNLGQQYHPWGLRRPWWPPNCHIAIEAHGSKHDKLMVGVRAPDVRRLGPHEVDQASAARPLLEDMTTRLPGGKKTNWWAWSQWLPEAWSSEFAARLVIDSLAGKVSESAYIQGVGRLVAGLALEVDQRIFKPTS